MPVRRSKTAEIQSICRKGGLSGTENRQAHGGFVDRHPSKIWFPQADYFIAKLFEKSRLLLNF